MEGKYELLNSIEAIKHKLTSQEYKTLLDNLAKIKVANQSNNGNESDTSLETLIQWTSRDVPYPTIRTWEPYTFTRENQRAPNIFDSGGGNLL